MTSRGDSQLVAVTGLPSKEDVQRVRQTASPHDVVVVPTVDDLGPLLHRATVVVGTLRPGQLVDAPKLRWVHSWSAGADRDLTDEMRASDVVLTSSSGNGGIPLAEHAMLLMLMLDRDAPRWLRAQADHRWDRNTHGELNARTLAIVGLGHAGADLAQKAKAFHMTVLGVRRRAELAVPCVDHLYAPERLHDMLSRSDFVVVTAPSTPGTRGMFGRAEFAAMPRHSYFVCISRGGIAQDDALLDALRSGEIAGAGIDAHGTEPLVADSPFWDLPNVIVTPHNGATTPGTARRGVDIFVENLRLYLQGNTLRNIVDKTVGY